MRGIFAAALFLSAGVFLCSCGQAPERTEAELLAEAETLVLDMKWAEAIPALKQCLILNPSSAGAHFYLGRCWLNVPEFNDRPGPWLILAEEETELALQLFKEQGEVSPIERFDDKYFELICHLERGKVYLRQLYFLMDNSGLVEGMTIQTVLIKFRSAYNEAKKVNPDSADVKTLEKLVIEFEKGFGVKPGSRT